MSDTNRDLGATQTDTTVHCFFGWRFRQCDAVIPDTEYETMRRLRWGFVLAPDPGSPTGEGSFYACPEHREI